MFILWNSVLFIFLSVDIPFLIFYDLDLILFGKAISLATGIFSCSVQSIAFTVREFISIQCDDVVLEFPSFTMNKLQSLCNDVNSTQTKPYSLRKTKALNKKLKKGKFTLLC